MKGGQPQQMGPPGSFPQQQMPTNNMTNGQMNGLLTTSHQMQQKVFSVWML